MQVAAVFLSREKMKSKIAVLIDGGFFVHRFKVLNKGAPPGIKDMHPFLEDLMRRIHEANSHTSSTLFRTFYYDCRPYGHTVTDPSGKKINYSNTPLFKAVTQFHNDLRVFPRLALRLGDLSFDGWKLSPFGTDKPPAPDFKQKSVDMKIGLDIAWMSSNRTIDQIVLVTGDSDFISPMKFARREGILVYLYTMGEKRIKLQLKEHCDILL
ncbi:MAG: NYN domain-containing protein [Balneolaceae bacterium]|nr:NYN domain-containing protein [Balneolaceae bacterium]